MKEKSNFKRTKYYKVCFKTASLFENNDSSIIFIKLKFPWTPENLFQVKSIKERKYNSEKKYWYIPASVENCFLLKSMGYIFKESLKNWANSNYTIQHHKPDLSKLKKTLREFQIEGIKNIEKFNGRALLADDMGLGKTIQSLTWTYLHSNEKPVIIICPASLKLNWQKEIQELFEKSTIEIISGEKAKKISKKEYIIINYDILQFWLVELKKLKPKIVIMDECHYIKNSKAKRTKAVKLLCKNIPYIIGLSGTPVESRPVEIYNSISIINPYIFPNSWYFYHRFCGAKHNGFGWDFSGSSNVEELHQILTEKIMIRRKKSEVLKDLPDKIYTTIPFKINNEKEYYEAETNIEQYISQIIDKNFKNKLKNLDEFEQLIDINSDKFQIYKQDKLNKINIMTQIETLKQLAVKGKLNEVINWIEDFLESDEKLVVFAEHIFTIETIYNHFKKIAVKIDGSTSMTKRNEAVTNFQTNKQTRLFIGNKAAETGITLTASSNVAIIEFPWTPGSLNQRIDRLHRIGQKNSVNCYFLISQNTIEEKILNLLKEQQIIVDKVLDGQTSETTSIFKNLINSFV